MPTLRPLLDAALHARADWLATLDRTDCWRLLHGAVEGAPGLTVDRYGDILLAQTFREPLTPAQLQELEAFAAAALPELSGVVWNHRGRSPAPEVPAPDPVLLSERIVHEHGLRFGFQARHRGLDPWLFLDFRAGRRWVRENAHNQTVLNLFAYTCGIGVAAAAGGATEVRNVDFAQSALDRGRRNAKDNGLPLAAFHTDQADVLPTIRQLAGLKVKGRGARRRYRRYEPAQHGLVVLDPPTFAKSPFGAVDPVRDYPSLFKPCVLTTRPGGRILATNHVSTVDRETWEASLWRTAEKAGRPLTSVEPLFPDPDFPSPDGRHPLKMAVCTVS